MTEGTAGNAEAAAEATGVIIDVLLVSEGWAARGLSLPMFSDLTIPLFLRISSEIEDCLAVEDVLTRNTA